MNLVCCRVFLLCVVVQNMCVCFSELLFAFWIHFWCVIFCIVVVECIQLKWDRKATEMSFCTYLDLVAYQLFDRQCAIPVIRVMGLSQLTRQLYHAVLATNDDHLC